MPKRTGGSRARSLASTPSKERPKDTEQREKRLKTSCKREPVAGLLDINTVLEVRKVLAVSALQPCPVFIYSTKYRYSRNRWLWEYASYKGYFIQKAAGRESVLRPVLGLHNSITDVTSDLIAIGYSQKQPTIVVRSRRHAVAYCRMARQTWLRHKMQKRPLENCRLQRVAGVGYEPPGVEGNQVKDFMSLAMESFRQTHDHVAFPVLSGLKQHNSDSACFLKKMQLLKNKCSGTVNDPESELKETQLMIPIQEWPRTKLAWATAPYAAQDDDMNFCSEAVVAQRRDLHTSEDVSVCLLYRLVLVTHNILKYLVTINIGRSTIVKERADEALVVSIRQQMTDSVLEMFLDPCAQVVDALFEAVMCRAAALVVKGCTSKHLRVRTLQQCRLGSAVASWQLSTLLLTSVGEAFAEAILTEVGSDEQTRKYCSDCLSLIPRLKDDCLYQMFQALSLRHRKVSLLQAAQNTEPVDPVTCSAVTLLTKMSITYALHLFHTQKALPKHVYLYEQDLEDDFSSFLMCLNGLFTVSVPQPPTSVYKLTDGRLKAFMMNMLVAYYKEVIEPSACEWQQTTAFD
ncbi:uncharacterized protein LOC125757492 [Rhipicephalus sanguineus]|uniref:Uncharacterized protein n=1 Tax=Rhipicephalus sanguineus TaxID=34632 RepID=A0A9D4T8M9_RHISA|nr:uncharacterized protein LOC125757492 [Rhipicephalus sanguineus]KAH7982535.1 hypothetical protein HPB52_005478 [Rhipicephalus sanguineus]